MKVSTHGEKLIKGFGWQPRINRTHDTTHCHSYAGQRKNLTASNEMRFSHQNFLLSRKKLVSGKNDLVVCGIREAVDGAEVVELLDHTLKNAEQIIRRVHAWSFFPHDVK